MRDCHALRLQLMAPVQPRNTSALARERGKRRPHRGDAEAVRAMYDTTSSGAAAPHTDYVSRREVHRLFAAFARVRIDVRNVDSFYLPYRNTYIPREKCLNNIARALGFGLYITAIKHTG